MVSGHGTELTAGQHRESTFARSAAATISETKMSSQYEFWNVMSSLNAANRH